MPQENKKKLSLLFFPFREKSLSGIFEGLFLSLIFVPILFSFYPVAFRFSMVNFTYGARGMDPVFKSLMWMHFFKAVVITYIATVIFRGLILRILLKMYSWRRAFIVHMVIANILLSFLLWHYGQQMRVMGFFRYLLMENLVFVFWSLYFMRTGSLLATALFSGLYAFIRYVIVNDVTGPFETLYFYSTASDDFYWLMISVTILAVSLISWWNQKRGMRELQGVR